MSKKPDLTKEKSDILMRKYSLLKQEIISTDSAYKNHVRNVLVFLSAALGIFGYATGQEWLRESKLFWIATSYTATTIIALLIYDLFESQYHIIALGSRLFSIEQAINKIFNERVLAWETSLADRFFGGGSAPMPSVWRPDYFLHGYFVFFFILVSFAAPGYATFHFCIFSNVDWFSAVIVGAYMYSLATGVWIAIVGRSVLLLMRKEAKILVKTELAKPLNPKQQT